MQQPKSFGYKFKKPLHDAVDNSCDHGSHKCPHSNNFANELFENLSNYKEILLFLSVLMLYFYYQKNKDHKMCLDAHKHDKNLKTVVGAGAGVVLVPTFYHTIGHRYGLPHFRGEEYLGEAIVSFWLALRHNVKRIQLCLLATPIFLRDLAKDVSDDVKKVLGK